MAMVVVVVCPLSYFPLIYASTAHVLCVRQSRLICARASAQTYLPTAARLQ